MTYTLDSARTGLLNDVLGLDNDSDNRFGSTTVRNLALQDGCRRLWPEMGLLLSETVTIVTGQLDYVLASVNDVTRVELTSSSVSTWYSDAGKDWSFWLDEDNGPTIRFPQAFDPTLSLTVWGYTRYTVPASGSDSFNLPDNQMYVVVDGAVSFLYRIEMNQFAAFQRHENENRRTALSSQEMMALYRDAEGRYQAGKIANRRRMVTPRRAVRIRP